MAKPLERGDPKRVGPYEVLGRLGEGGMGKVFLARSRDGLLVAVKVVHPRLMRDAGARRRFEREVRAARRIDGTYTAAVIAADVNADPPWLATVYVPAFPLSDVLTRLGPLAEESVRALGVGLAEAVTAIHAAEIIHRDLKPSNVLVTPGGPKVIDFGISALAEASTLTRPGEVVGTLGFMAPEQLAGNAVPASDVFSLGGVLLYAATGRPPFGAGSAQEVLYRIRNEPPDLRDSPRRLRPLIEGCLAKDPEQRLSLAQLSAELTRARASESSTIPEQAKPPPTVVWLPSALERELAARDPVPQTAKPRGQAGAPRPATGPDGFDLGHTRRKGLVLGLGGVLLSIGGAGAVWRFFGRPPEQAGPWHARNPGPLFSTPVLANDVVCIGCDDGTVRAFDALSGHLKWTKQTGGNVESNGSANESSLYIGSRDGNLYALNAEDGAVRWSRYLGGGFDWQTQAAAGAVYSARTDGLVCALHPDKGEVIWQKQFNQACSGLALGQNRLYVTVADSGHVYCLGSSSGDQVWDASLGTRNLSAPTLGGAMLYVGSDHYLYAVASDSGTVRWRVPSRGTFSAPAVADGTVYAGSTDNMLYAIDATKGAVNWAFDAGAAVHARPAIVDGSVFFGNTNHAFYAIKASSGKPVWQSRLSGAVSTWPTAANGLIYVASDVDLFALDATTGAAPDVIAAQAPTSTVPQGAADVVRAYYAAVNAKDFRSAWEWGGKHLRPPYQSFVAGYAHTVSVGLQISQVHGAVVAVRISSVEDDGTVKVYEGTYTVSGDSIVSAAISEVSSSRTP